MSGTAPVGRFGHTMEFLPTNNSLIVVGGRNDEMCKQNATPFLDDIFLFLLDQKFWLQIKHSVTSERIDYLGNQCMTVITDNESIEKILMFGGITNRVGADRDPNNVQSFLSN